MFDLVFWACMSFPKLDRDFVNMIQAFSATAVDISLLVITSNYSGHDKVDWVNLTIRMLWID
jgi:hypothetical protein